MTTEPNKLSAEDIFDIKEYLSFDYVEFIRTRREMTEREKYLCKKFEGFSITTSLLTHISCLDAEIGDLLLNAANSAIKNAFTISELRNENAELKKAKRYAEVELSRSRSKVKLLTAQLEIAEVEKRQENNR